MRIFIVLLFLTLVSTMGLTQDTTGTIVILSNKIGPTIDLEERNFYRMFLSIQNFESAVLLQKPDSSYIFKVISWKENEPSVKFIWIPSTEEEVERIRLHIDPDYRIKDPTLQRTDSTREKSRSENINEEPAYRSRYITEFGYSYQITPPLKGKEVQADGNSVTHAYEWQVTGRHYLTSELGYIHDLNSKYGLGVTHFTGWNVMHYLHGGLKLRIRRWLNPKTSLDLSVGSILWGLGSDFKQPAFIGDISLNFSNRKAVNVMIEVLETKSYDNSYYYEGGILKRDFTLRRRNVGVYLGCKLGSKTGLVFHGIALAASVFAFILFASLYEGD